MEIICKICGKPCKGNVGIKSHMRFKHPVPATESNPSAQTATETATKIKSKRIDIGSLPGRGGRKITDLPPAVLDDAKRRGVHLHWGTTDRHEQAVALMENHLLMEGYTICTRYTEENEDLKKLYGANPGGGLRRGRLILLECPQYLYDARKQQDQNRLDLVARQRREGFKEQMTSEIQKVTQLPMKVTEAGLTQEVERR